MSLLADHMLEEDRLAVYSVGSFKCFQRLTANKAATVFPRFLVCTKNTDPCFHSCCVTHDWQLTTQCRGCKIICARPILVFLNGRPLFSFNRIHYFLPTWYFFIMGPQCENRFVRACVQTVDESVLCARLKHNHKLWLATEIVTEKAVEG